jgi:hypothetical protein
MERELSHGSKDMAFEGVLSKKLFSGMVLRGDGIVQLA